MMFDLKGARVLVVGGSSGIGLGAAKMAAELGAAVTIASRSSAKLNAATEAIGHGAASRVLDTGDGSAVEALFADNAPFDHIIVSASQTRVAAVKELALADAYQSMNSKFWGAYRIARASRINEHGSLTLVSGYLSVRPRKGNAIQGAINASVEGLTRGLALELAPVRVNCVSPGLVDTPLLDRFGERKAAMMEEARKTIPAGIVGMPEHIARQIIAFMTNPFMTGSVVYLDGGGSIA
jgi:NAD(P)-dependent dehydrogenase (short-subunit alcohol dehydrogenase family)